MNLAYESIKTSSNSSQFFESVLCKPRSWPMSTPIISILLSRYFRTPDWLTDRLHLHILQINNHFTASTSEMRKKWTSSIFPFFRIFLFWWRPGGPDSISHHLAHVIFTHSPHFSFFNFFHRRLKSREMITETPEKNCENYFSKYRLNRW